MIDLTTTRLYQEIHEQPGVLARLLASEGHAVAGLAEEIRRRGISPSVRAGSRHQQPTKPSVWLSRTTPAILHPPRVLRNPRTTSSAHQVS